MCSQAYEIARAGLVILATCGGMSAAMAGSIPFTLNGVQAVNGVIQVTALPLENGDGFFTGTATESVTQFSDSITITGTSTGTGDLVAQNGYNNYQGLGYEYISLSGTFVPPPAGQGGEASIVGATHSSSFSPIIPYVNPVKAPVLFPPPTLAPTNFSAFNYSIGTFHGPGASRERSPLALVRAAHPITAEVLFCRLRLATRRDQSRSLRPSLYSASVCSGLSAPTPGAGMCRLLERHTSESQPKADSRFLGLVSGPEIALRYHRVLTPRVCQPPVGQVIQGNKTGPPTV